MPALTRPALLVVPMVALLALTGCGPKKTAARTPAAPAPVAGGSSSRAPGGAGKTCPAGHTSATINGATKCLAVGQQCSSKAINSYPQYGYICASSNGRLTLRRK